MENMRMRTDRDDANGSRFRGKVKEQSVKEIQLGFGKLSLDEVPRSPKNPNAMKPRKDVQFRSGGKTSSSRKEPIALKPLKDVNFGSGGKTSSSRKEPIALKPLKDVNFRFGDKRPQILAMKDDTPAMNLSCADVMKYLRGDDAENVAVVSVDKRVLDEAKERKEEQDEFYFRVSEDMRREAHEFATAAISYMRKKGHNLELVKPCLYNQGEIERGIRTHFNFKAKRADDPSAPVETYFGQLRDCGYSNLVVECCVSLGASDSLPYERDNHGCRYCPGQVHHPEGGCKGIKWGRLTWSPRLRMHVIT